MNIRLSTHLNGCNEFSLGIKKRKCTKILEVFEVTNTLLMVFVGSTPLVALAGNICYDIGLHQAYYTNNVKFRTSDTMWCWYTWPLLLATRFCFVQLKMLRWLPVISRGKSRQTTPSARQTSTDRPCNLPVQSLLLAWLHPTASVHPRETGEIIKIFSFKIL